MLVLDEFEDFRYDMILVAEKEMYIYSKAKTFHQPYQKPKKFKGETSNMYYKVKEDRERGRIRRRRWTILEQLKQKKNYITLTTWWKHERASNNLVKDEK